MTAPGAEAPTLRLVAGTDLPAALADALDGGPPVAPLPEDPVERRQAYAALAPEVPVSEADAAAVVCTSGSTGRPRAVVLSRAALRAAVAAGHARLGGPGQWLLALPEHYVAGLMVCARALDAGSAPLRVGRDLAGLPEPDGTRRYLSVVPTQLVRALADPGTTRRLAGLAAVLVGGGPVAADVLGRARDAGIRVVTTYGASETCGGVVYDGRPLDAVTVRLGDDGRVQVAGPTLFSGYRLRPDLTSAALRDGWWQSGDRGTVVDGRLAVLGRVDELVVTGGRKVDLAEVERVAREWADELAVVAVPDPEWGTAVVAVTAADRSADDLQEHLTGRLPAYALPRRVVRVAALPRTAGGKVDRQRLVRDLAAAG